MESNPSIFIIPSLLRAYQEPGGPKTKNHPFWKKTSFLPPRETKSHNSLNYRDLYRIGLQNRSGTGPWGDIFPPVVRRKKSPLAFLLAFWRKIPNFLFRNKLGKTFGNIFPRWGTAGADLLVQNPIPRCLRAGRSAGEFWDDFLKSGWYHKKGNLLAEWTNPPLP